MDCGHSVYFRRLVGVGVMVAFLATAFAPAMAASEKQPDSSAFSNKSIAKVVASTPPDSPNRTERTIAETPKAAKQATKTGAFFKTRTGLVVLAVMAAGTGYALYSLKEDRIRGSIR